jgi:hypothetical protein
MQVSEGQDLESFGNVSLVQDAHSEIQGFEAESQKIPLSATKSIENSYKFTSPKS